MFSVWIWTMLHTEVLSWLKLINRLMSSSYLTASLTGVQLEGKAAFTSSPTPQATPDPCVLPQVSSPLTVLRVCPLQIQHLHFGATLSQNCSELSAVRV